MKTHVKYRIVLYSSMSCKPKAEKSQIQFNQG